MKALRIVPTSIADAIEFVRQHHRHHRPPVSGLYAVALAENDEIVGVAITGRPVARRLDDGWTAEVTRLCCIPGHPNACSKLYRACWRIAKEMGYLKLITYTLPEEGGASLRGAGFRCIGQGRGGSWSVPSRPRVDRHPTQPKLKWELTA